jgi:methionyl-tRNA formyltransferase
MAGDEVTGAATFRIEEGLDTGPVFGVVTEEIRPRDTSGDLLGRLAVSGARLLVATMDGIADGTLFPQPQPTEGVSLAPKIDVDAARVDWTAPALRVDRVIRACTPAPGAWTTWRDTRLKLGPVKPAGTAELAPGQLDGDRVGTGGGDVVLGEVKPEGKGWMPAAAWRNGARPQPGERLA